jgi:hypothetical protein
MIIAVASMFVYPQPTTIEEICNAMIEVFGFSRRIPVIPYDWPYWQLMVLKF